MALRLAALGLLVFVLVGCGPKEEPGMDANSIAVPQEGNGPPPMNAPMKESTATPGQ